MVIRWTFAQWNYPDCLHIVRGITHFMARIISNFMIFTYFRNKCEGIEIVSFFWILSLFDFLKTDTKCVDEIVKGYSVSTLESRGNGNRPNSSFFRIFSVIRYVIERRSTSVISIICLFHWNLRFSLKLVISKQKISFFQIETVAWLIKLMTIHRLNVFIDTQKKPIPSA